MPERPLIVIGHKNPDTDSICAAIAYSHLKTLGGSPAVAYRAGNLNSQTSFVLRHFGVDSPPLLTDVYPRVRDIMFGRNELIVLTPGEPIGRAFDLMVKHQFSFLPVISDRRADRCMGKVNVLKLAEELRRIAEIRNGTRLRVVIPELVRRLRGRWVSKKPPAGTFEGRLVAPALGGDETIPEPGTRSGSRSRPQMGPQSGAQSEPGEEPRIVLLPYSAAADRAGTRDAVGDGRRSAVDLFIIYDAPSGGPEDANATPKARGAANARGTASAGGLASPRRLSVAQRGFAAPPGAAGAPILLTGEGLMKTITGLVFAAPVAEYVEEIGPTFLESDRIRKVEREINRYNVGGFIVTDEHGAIRGVITRVHFLSQARFRIILVDHNELAQSVDGADLADILEVIDHHRIGVRNTDAPITFINKVVGSTCSIIAEMFRNSNIEPPRPIAGLMLSALLSDTVILKSPTTTEFDREIAQWLAALAGEEIESYGKAMFAAGSKLAELAPEQVIRQDQKIYEENGFKFAVSQIETVGFDAFYQVRDNVTGALESARMQLGCGFACLLVTDITSEASLFVIVGDQRVRAAVRYPAAGDGVFEMAGVVSRKKQLLPYLLDLLKGL